MERNVLVGGQVLTTHEITQCKGEYCTIHKFSDHHMVTWKQMYDHHSARMFRICSHNIAHVDPDELPTTSRKHKCDGCCDPATQFSSDFAELVKDYSPPAPPEPEPYSPPTVVYTTTGTASGTHLHAGVGTTTTITYRHKGIDQ